MAIFNSYVSLPEGNHKMNHHSYPLDLSSWGDLTGRNVTRSDAVFTYMICPWTLAIFTLR